MNLIEELGIETCRAIVDGAKWSTHFRTDTKEYVCCPNEAHFYFRENVERGVEFIRIDDLRTAISAHDQHWYGQSEEKELEQYSLLQQEKIEGTAALVGDFTAIQEQLQTELNNCSKKDSSEISISDCCTDNLSHFTDNCTDIRNHLSPLMKVIER